MNMYDDPMHHEKDDSSYVFINIDDAPVSVCNTSSFEEISAANSLMDLDKCESPLDRSDKLDCTHLSVSQVSLNNSNNATEESTPNNY